MSAATRLTEAELVAIRADARTKPGRFVDPAVIAELGRVLDRRGEVWAAAILGRPLDRRARLDRRRPWLTDAEPYAVISADRAEDKVALRGLS